MINTIKSVLRPIYHCSRKWKSANLSWREFAWFRRLSFSQFGEDIFVDQYFSQKDEGIYVDIGAFHPVGLSNTYLLYRRGWKGICIEPHPEHFVDFPKLRPRDVNLNLAVSTTEGNVPFCCDDVCSGISDKTHIHANRNPMAKKISVKARSLASILDEYLADLGEEIDLISVDCEGHDMEVLRSNDWSRFRPKLILVENHRQSKDSDPEVFLAQYGYHFISRLGLTDVYELRKTIGSPTTLKNGN